MQLLIPIYLNEAETFPSNLFSLDFSQVAAEQVAYWKKLHLFRRQITEHFKKLIHWDINEIMCSV
jgi:hypothetical protein